jgi:hypothetical protein
VKIENGQIPADGTRDPCSVVRDLGKWKLENRADASAEEPGELSSSNTFTPVQGGLPLSRAFCIVNKAKGLQNLMVVSR